MAHAPSSNGRRADARPSEVVVAGGGIAGLEALLALHHLAGDRASLTLVSAEPEFTYRPTVVEEPFSPVPAGRRDVAEIAAELDARFVHASVVGVDLAARTIALDGNDEAVTYDAAVICVGARAREPFPSVATLAGSGEAPINELLARAVAHPSRRIAFIVPPGVSWPLPIYELALKAARRARDLDYALEVVIVSPEAGPLIMFGAIASRRVYELLRAREVSFLPAAYASEDGGGIVLSPGANRLDAGAAVALPLLEGPGIDGLPRDSSGFIPIDDRARVRGTEGLYAAGDGTTFPIKHGGIAKQQADAAAEQIAAALGSVSDPKAFRPILRGKLILGQAWLDGAVARADRAPSHQPIDVEVSLPSEWHREPTAIDPYASLSRD